MRTVLIYETIPKHRALVVGYGSIGQRHAQRLELMGCKVSVCSRRAVNVHRRFSDIAQAVSEFAPDYIVLASQTHEHLENLNDLVAAGYTGKVLVEKPLFSDAVSLPSHRFAHLRVAYNLRFHPLISKLRDALRGQDICSYQVYVGQYLPTWRPDADYRESYSSDRARGGGVLRDLSHDLDYSMWMLGGWLELTAQGGHVSNLEISSDDCFMVMLKTPRCPLVSIHLNYLDRKSRREIIVTTNNFTIRVDLVEGSFEIDGEREDIAVERNLTYDLMHRAMLDGDDATGATAQEGSSVMDMIAAIETASKVRTWITR